MHRGQHGLPEGHDWRFICGMDLGFEDDFAIVVAAYGLMRGLGSPGARWPWLLAGAGFLFLPERILAFIAVTALATAVLLVIAARKTRGN